MSRSHDPAPKPSSLLALVALGIVFRFCPAWIAVDLASATAEHGMRADRLSRLVSRAIGAFETIVVKLSRRGRPPHDDAEERAQRELALTRELLGVATAVLAGVSLRRRAVSELVVGAFGRLQKQYGITLKRFCETLALSERTFRDWRSRACKIHVPKTESAQPPAHKPARPRPLRRGRFGFDVLLPGTQIGADTTDLVAFDVSLKLLAAQDIGGRDSSLFDNVIVDDHESAALVARVFEQALRDKPGAQAITDQGTPYLARYARGALEALEAEHAPQREADPLGKATVERGFGTLKRVAAPLLELTNRIARAVPELACPTLAKASVQLLMTALLRAYQHGARAGRSAADARGSIDPDELARRAELSRDHARATDRSTRLWLERFHLQYEMTGGARSFVASFRSYPLVVLQDAEHHFRSHAHRDDIRKRQSYFAAIVRRLNDDFQRRRKLETMQVQDDAALARRKAEHRDERAKLAADPIAWLRYALELIAMQWLPREQALLFGGIGFGLGHLRAALERLVAVHGVAVHDIARGVLHDFCLAHADRIGTVAISAIAVVLERDLGKLPCTLDCAPDQASAILRSTGRLPRPPPPNRLRI